MCQQLSYEISVQYYGNLILSHRGQNNVVVSICYGVHTSLALEYQKEGTQKQVLCCHLVHATQWLSIEQFMDMQLSCATPSRFELLNLLRCQMLCVKQHLQGKFSESKLGNLLPQIPVLPCLMSSFICIAYYQIIEYHF